MRNSVHTQCGIPNCVPPEVAMSLAKGTTGPAMSRTDCDGSLGIPVLEEILEEHGIDFVDVGVGGQYSGVVGGVVVCVHPDSKIEPRTAGFEQFLDLQSYFVGARNERIHLDTQHSRIPVRTIALLRLRRETSRCRHKNRNQKNRLRIRMAGLSMIGRNDTSHAIPIFAWTHPARQRGSPSAGVAVAAARCGGEIDRPPRPTAAHAIGAPG